MLQLENSLLHIATRQGQPEDHHYRGSAQLQLERRLHHNYKDNLSHLLQLKRHPEFTVGRSHPSPGHEEKTGHARLFRIQGTLQVGLGLYPTLYPPPLLLLFLFALLKVLVFPAERPPAPLSPNKDQLRALINKSPGHWFPMKGSGMKEMFQVKTLLLALWLVWQMRTNAHDCSQHLNHKQHKEPGHKRP